MSQSNASASSNATITSQFREKVTAMKAWKPENSPSNRDRLELYALHKQAIAADAPEQPPPMASAAEKAKWTAWRGLAGTPQVQAMQQYIRECDRQMRVYGTADGHDLSSPQTQQRTPTNTPAASHDMQGEDTSWTSRGLAAVPLLCAAATETRPAYLVRLSNTQPHSGWWGKQEPLCADPDTFAALPETAILWAASAAETLSLSAPANEDSYLVSAAVIQSFLWPFHNVLLATWIVLIFWSTAGHTTFMCATTLLWGSNINSNSNIPLSTLFGKEIVPAAAAAASLCESHQAVSVRLAGLLLTPYVILCRLAQTLVNGAGLWVGALAYCFCTVTTWWYWCMVVPYCTIAVLCFSLGCGWCFAAIEMAGLRKN